MKEEYIVPNLGKTCRILNLLSCNQQGLSCGDVVKKLSIPRTTVFRIFNTLLKEGFVEKSGPKYFVGPGLIELSSNALSNLNLRELSIPFLYELAQKTGETTHLAIPSGYHSLIVEVCDSPNPVRVASRPGTIVALNCSSTGKVFLAYLYANEFNDIYEKMEIQKRTGKTLVEYCELENEIHDIARQGYAMDDEEYHNGVRCAAAPVYNNKFETVGAIGITASTMTFTEEKRAELIELILNAARGLSKKLGAKI